MRLDFSSSDIFKSRDSILLFVSEERVSAINNNTEGNSRGYINKLISQYVSFSLFKGKISDSLIIPTPDQTFSSIILSGLGKESKISSESIRRVAHISLRMAVKHKIKKISVKFPDTQLPEKEVIRAISDGFRLSNYAFDKYKTGEDAKLFRVADAKIFLKKLPTSDLKSVLHYSKVSCDAVNFARDMQNENADIINPEEFVRIAKRVTKGNKLRIKILNKKQLEREGLYLHLAVSQGSRFEPALIILEYSGNNSSKERTAIVGKGVTFDSGGLNIKTKMMAEMNLDMCGAAVTLATIKATAELNLKKNIIAVIPVCENAVGQASYKPGSVIKSYLGKTVEIGNTDAEGRLILADALAYTNKNYKPTNIIDLATLTGNIIVALGHNYAGLYSDDAELLTKLKSAAEMTGDRVWQMPLIEDYAKKLKSKKADLSNISNYKGYAGSITAALFLKNFVGKTPWAHIDIAGTSIRDAPHFYNPFGGTGFGVRLLCDFLVDN